MSDTLRPDANEPGDPSASVTVSVNGTISVSNQVFSLGKQRAGHLVDVRILEELLEVWDGRDLLKNVLRSTRGEVRKKRAEPHRSHKPIK
jgi:hypothetical protein